MPPQINAALVLIATVLFTAMSTKLSLDKNLIPALASAFVLVGVAAFGTVSGWMKSNRIQRAERRSPGVTDKLEPTEELTVIQIKNDTSNPLPPMKTSTYTPPVVAGPEIKGPSE